MWGRKTDGLWRRRRPVLCDAMSAAGTRKSVRELKDTLISRGVDISGIIERDELEELYKRSEKEEHAAQASNKSKRSRGDTDAEAFLRYARAAEVLGVSLTASDDAIAAAHKRLLKLYHPDRSQGDERKFKDAREAFELLTALPLETRVAMMRQAEQQHAERRAARLAAHDGSQSQAKPSWQPQQPQQQPKQQEDKPQQRKKKLQPRAQKTAAHTPQGPSSSSYSSSIPTHPSSTPATPTSGPVPPRAARQHTAQFQEILAAATRESQGAAQRQGGLGTEEHPAPTPWNVALPAGHNAERGGILEPCIECFTCMARLHLEFSRVVYSCAACLLDCGGLLRLNDRELHSWGHRKEEAQIGRFHGACGDLSAAEARARRRTARKASAHNGAATTSAAQAQPQHEQEQHRHAHLGAAPYKV